MLAEHLSTISGQHADGQMGREKALAFITICSIAVVFVLKTVSVLHSEESPLQNSRHHREPVETSRTGEVWLGSFGWKGCVLSIIPAARRRAIVHLLLLLLWCLVVREALLAGRLGRSRLHVRDILLQHEWNG